MSASPEPPDPVPTKPDAAAELGSAYAAALLGETPLPTDTAPPSPVRIIEALLFIGGAPLTALRAGDVIRGLTPEQFGQAIDELTTTYRRQGRPYAVQPRGPGFVLALRPRYQNVVEKLHGGVREARLSTAAVDVLALVAYRQPVTKAEIDSLRGAESGALLRQLVRRGLIQVAYRGEASHKEVSYGTTARFLELFGLQNLDDLPRTRDLQQL
jgi:segregation and condensation protein B